MNLIMNIENLKPEHFNPSNQNGDITLEIWGEDVLLQNDIHFYGESQDIAPFFEEIKERLLRFSEDKGLVLQNIIDKGYLKTAEAWAADSNISLPISKEQFLDSFYPFEIGVSIGNIEDEPTVMVYLGSTIEYFSDHILCCYIKKSNNQMEYQSVLEG